MVSWHLEESGHTSTSLEYMDDKNDTNDGDGVCWVHKPGVLYGPASQQRLGPTDDVANDAQTPEPAQIPKNDRPEGRSSFQPEGLAEKERRPLPTLAGLSDRKASLPTPAHLRMASPTGRPGQTPLSTPTRVPDRGCVEPLLTALLQLAQSEPTGTNRSGTSAW